MFVRLLLAALLMAGLASAQGKKGGGGGMGGGAMTPSMPSGKPSKLEQFADKLKLTKEQKDECTTALSAAMEQSRDVRGKLDQSRVQIAGALIEGKTGDDLKKLMDDYTSLAAQLTDIEAQAFGKIYQSLKPNQQVKAAQAFELLVAVLDMPAGGRPGGRGRGRQ